MAKHKSDNESVEIDDVVVHAATDAAILVETSDGDEVWIPKSQLRQGTNVIEEGDKGKIIVPRWIAVEKEIWDD